MRWEDQAIILHIAKHSNTSAILTLFTKEHGIENGFVKGAFSNKQNLNPGLVVNCIWSARLAEHLGNFTLTHIYNDNLLPLIMSSSTKMFALQSIIQITKTCFMPSEPHKDFYILLKNFISEELPKDNWLLSYINLELALLNNIGFGLDLSECAVTKSREDLAYVSPKTGRAVSRLAGEAYKEKLLALPEFLIKSVSELTNIKEITMALKLTGFFIRKFLEHDRGKIFPHSRIILEESAELL